MPSQNLLSKEFKAIRLSMDFRVKFGNPYYYENKIVNYKKFVFKKRATRLGYYWLLNKKKFKDLK